MRYEMKINVVDPKYVDTLIVALARQGYAPYYNDEAEVVCFEICDYELTELDKSEGSAN